MRNQPSAPSAPAVAAVVAEVATQDDRAAEAQLALLADRQHGATVGIDHPHLVAPDRDAAGTGPRSPTSIVAGQRARRAKTSDMP